MTREEAIAVIRKNYPHVGFSGTEFETALRELIPELAESGDAMMEKAIVDALLSHCNSINLLSARGYQIEDVKAWLEKQKEQKPNYCHYGGDPNIERCRCCSAACSGRLADEQKPKAKAKSPLSPHELYDAKIEGISQGRQDVIDHPEQFGLQKPAERREVELTFRGEKVKVKRHFFRDDKGREYSTTEQDEDAAWYALRAWCEKKGISMYDLYPRKEWSEEDKKIAETICKEGDLKPSEKRWLKSLPERFNLPPKQEWSKEDEKWFEEIELMVLYFTDDEKYREKFISWLKSLKNRGNFPKSNTNSPSWSEEEIFNRTYEEGFNDGLKYRKPVKRNDEDKKMSDWLIGLVNANTELSFKDKVNLTRWLEHLTIEKEFSKNDKRIIDAIKIGYQDKDFRSSQIPTPIGVSKDEVIDWLKSLRPQPRWKPSEERSAGVGK